MFHFTTFVDEVCSILQTRPSNDNSAQPVAPPPPPPPPPASVLRKLEQEAIKSHAQANQPQPSIPKRSQLPPPPRKQVPFRKTSQPIKPPPIRPSAKDPINPADNVVIRRKPASNPVRRPPPISRQQQPPSKPIKLNNDYVRPTRCAHKHNFSTHPSTGNIPREKFFTSN